MEDIILEIVDSTIGKQLMSGEVGEVTVTTFDEVYPLIRYGTGDLSYYSDVSCACGRTSDWLMRIVDRVGDAVEIRGVFVPSETGRAVFEHFPKGY